MLKDDVDALFVGDTADFVGNLLLVVIDGVVGAQFARLRQLAFVAGGRDHLGAQHLADLDGSRADAGSCA